MAAIRNPYQQYKQNQVETADQATLLLMLFSGALKFLKAARKAMDANDVEDTNHQIGRVQDILCELMGSLNPDVPDISNSLFQLYEYMHHQLVQANIKKDIALIDEVDKMLNTLLEAWQAAVKQDKADKEAATAAAAADSPEGEEVVRAERRSTDSRG